MRPLFPLPLPFFLREADWDEFEDCEALLASSLPLPPFSLPLLLSEALLLSLAADDALVERGRWRCCLAGSFW